MLKIVSFFPVKQTNAIQKKKQRKEDYVCSYTGLFMVYKRCFFFYRNITVLRTVLNKAKRVFTLLFWIFALRLDAVEGKNVATFVMS